MHGMWGRVPARSITCLPKETFPQMREISCLGSSAFCQREVHKEFRADYSRSLKNIYTEVVDYLVMMTERVDVILRCSSFHHTAQPILPSYVRD